VEKIYATSLPSIKFRKNGDKRFKKGHPWVFSNELEDTPKYESGTMVSLLSDNNKIAAIGYYNPHSLIAFRELVRSDLIKDKFIEERIKKALNYRARMYPKEEAKRLVYGESDRLPGLIIDLYGESCIIQILTAGMEKLKDKVVDAVEQIVKPEKIIFKNDTPSRILENLEKQIVLVKGGDTLIEANFLGVKFHFDAEKAQKTGLFLDQRDNISILSSFDFKEKRVLDLFSYFGSWGIRALNLGAESVTFVDSSRYALQIASQTAENSGFHNFFAVESNVFDYLSSLISKGEKFDFVFSDPPAFAKSSKHIKEAYRAYARLNEKCFRVLNKGGILVASSCSHHIPYEIFLNSLEEASSNSKRQANLLFSGRQSLDHPILLNFPESSYLKTFFLKLEE
jgi:23S rRNA (cytosine1962-C5)-methyltransferase